MKCALITLSLIVYTCFAAYSQATFISKKSKRELYTYDKYILSLSDGGYISKEVYDDADRHLIISRYSHCHQLLWSKDIRFNPQYGGESAFKCVETSDSGILITFYSGINTSYFYRSHIIKFDLSGNILWSKYINISINQYINGKVPIVTSIAGTSNGECIIFGYINSYKNAITTNDSGLYFLMTLKSNGDQKWCKYYDASIGHSLQSVSNIIETKDKGFTFFTNAVNMNGGAIYFPSKLFKIDSSGDIMWVKNILTRVADKDGKKRESKKV